MTYRRTDTQIDFICCRVMVSTNSKRFGRKIGLVLHIRAENKLDMNQKYHILIIIVASNAHIKCNLNVHFWYDSRCRSYHYTLLFMKLYSLTSIIFIYSRRAEYVPVFKALGVTCVVRFNSKCYDRNVFIASKIRWKIWQWEIILIYRNIVCFFSF